MTDPGADKLLGEWLVRLLADQVPGELKLDLLEAAAKRNQPALKEKLETYESRRPKDDVFAGYRETLVGGNAEAGKKIFLERADVACVKCHKAGGEGGEVGPDLVGVATRQNREYLLESLVFPNKQIAAGFETLIVVQNDGPAYAGILKSETDQELVINSPEDGLVTVKKSNIKRRQRGQSGMPEGMGTVLTKVELRDLIEFLASLK
jgi:quinoprotein glucose dehydrogenase